MSRATDLISVIQEAEPAQAPNLLGQPPQNPKQLPAPDKPNPAQQKPSDNAKAGPAPGGILFRIDLTPTDFKNQIKTLQQITIVKDKKTSSQFEIFRDPGRNEFQLFHLLFDKKAFDTANTNPERAQRIKYVGAFKSKDSAVEFLKKEAARTDPAKEIGKGSPTGQPGWNKGQMGF